MDEASEAAEAFKALTETWPEDKWEIVLVPEVVRDTAQGKKPLLARRNPRTKCRNLRHPRARGRRRPKYRALVPQKSGAQGSLPDGDAALSHRKGVVMAHDSASVTPQDLPLTSRAEGAKFV